MLSLIRLPTLHLTKWAVLLHVPNWIGLWEHNSDVIVLSVLTVSQCKLFILFLPVTWLQANWTNLCSQDGNMSLTSWSSPAYASMIHITHKLQGWRKCTSMTLQALVCDRWWLGTMMEYIRIIISNGVLMLREWWLRVIGRIGTWYSECITQTICRNWPRLFVSEKMLSINWMKWWCKDNTIPVIQK